MRIRPVLAVAIAGLLTCAAAAGGADAVPLPPLAKVLRSDRDGQTWQQSGEMSGTVEAAQREFVSALGAAGWVLDKTIVMGHGAGRSELMVWHLRSRRILFMVWEMEAGTCGFAWGQEQEGQAGAPARERKA